MQLDDFFRERCDVLVPGGVAQEGREVRVRVGGGCDGYAVAEPRRIADSHLEVVVSLRGDRLHDGAEAAGGVRQGNPPSSVGILAEGSATPDILCERPEVVDVLEALANRLVAEPLADRLRGVPAVDEQGASGAEAPVPARWPVVHSGYDCGLE